MNYETNNITEAILKEVVIHRYMCYNDSKDIKHDGYIISDDLK